MTPAPEAPAKKPPKPWHPERYLRPAADTQHARIPLRWMTSPAYRVLSGSAQSALLALAGLLSGAGGVEWGQASYSEIAAYAVTCRRSAINAVQELRAFGWLDFEKTTTKYGSRDANRYRVIPPKDLGPGKNQAEKPSEAAAPARQPLEGEQLAAEWYAAYRPDASPSRSEKVLAGLVVQKFGLDTARDVLRQAMRAAKGWIPNIFGGLRPYIRPFLDGTRPPPAAPQPAPEPTPEDLAGVEALHALGKLQALVVSLATEVGQLPAQDENTTHVLTQLSQAATDIADAVHMIGWGDLSRVRWCPAALAQAQAAIQAAQAALGRT